MPGRLLERLGRPVTFVVGKGGVGKSTMAAGFALALADSGAATHLVSTDPAHSLGDLFRQPLSAGPAPARCAAGLTLEELDAPAHARDRLASLEPALREIIELGTYLDEEDASLLLGASVPGLDEVGAALRLIELGADAPRLVVDTAPTGHTLRLLDIHETVRGWIDVFEAMAAKADAVASALLHASVRLRAESELERLVDDMARFDALVRRADFLVVTAPGAVVRAETDRLVDALRGRDLSVVATVAAARPGARADVLVPVRAGLAGCDALRDWWAAAADQGPAMGEARDPGSDRSPAESAAGSPEGPREAPLPDALDRELVVFAGKGGVGKSTCAAALAVRLSRDGPVSLIGADPAGSLADVLGGPVPGLTVLEMDAEAELDHLRDRFRAEVEEAFEAIGLDHAARLDRQVVESLWGAAPPGLDELVAVGRLADAAGPGARVVLDTAPTGHFLRLMAMPELALDWVHRIMRILLKYRSVGGVDAPGGALLRLAKELRALRERLVDPARASIVVVTLDEPIVVAETERLLDRLRQLELPLAAMVVNRVERPDGGAVGRGGGLPVLHAPVFSEPVGPGALAAFFAAWTPVS